MDSAYDAVVVGGGHNGLVAAAYLARAGRRVVVFEKRPVVGGACVTEEFLPGYRNSSCSYLVSYLRPEIVRDLGLERRGYEVVPITTGFYPLAGGDSLLLTGDEDHDRAEIGRFSNTDWDGLRRMGDDLRRLADVLEPWLLRAPPRVDGARLADVIGWLGLANAVRKLPGELRVRFVQMFTQSASQWLGRYLASDAAKLPKATGVVAGFFNDLDQPGSAFRLVQGSFGGVGGVRGRWGLPRGGMGAISEAIAGAAAEAGAEIITGVGVERILTWQGAAIGVVLENGREVRARAVLCNADPKRLFLSLVPDDDLDPDFRRDIGQYRCESGSFRMNLALSGLPEFACRPGRGPGAHHRGLITICPSTDYLREAFAWARRGEYSRRPVIDALIPTVHDPSLAPPGHHVMSLTCRFFPRELAGGRSWDDEKEAAADVIVDTLAEYAPDLKGAIVGRMVLSPLDLEREYGLTGGDVFHGQYDPHQLFSFRPHPLASDCRTPVRGLYLCGAGAHPGGGVSGAPGYNAARAVLADGGRYSAAAWRMRTRSSTAFSTFSAPSAIWLTVASSI